MQDIDLVELFQREVIGKSRIYLFPRSVDPEEILVEAIKISKKHALESRGPAAFAYGVTAFQLQQRLSDLGEYEILDRTEIDFARTETEKITRKALSPGKPSSEIEILKDTMLRLQGGCLSTTPENAFAQGYAAAEIQKEIKDLAKTRECGSDASRRARHALLQGRPIDVLTIP